MDRPYSRLCARIDLDALLHNVKVMSGRLAPGAGICAVVKADAYGHGAAPVAAALEKEEVIRGFACATADEAVVLREAGIRKPILLLGYTFEENDIDLLDYDLRPCVFDLETAERLSALCAARGGSLKIHIAVDTGMGRIGFAPTEESADTVKRIADLPGITVDGMFTHFARADEEDGSPVGKQYALYDSFRRMLSDRGVLPRICHVSNSAAIMRFPEVHLGLTRAGIILYGLMPSEDVAREMGDLHPVMSLVSHISYVKTLPAGSPVSYGGTYVTEADTRVATIPAGYADGYPRQLSNKGYVLIRGQRAPVIGRVCMDQFMVDVTKIPDAARGDEVVLLGAQGEGRITAEELGRLSGRFNYELVCCVSRRVPRVYTLGGHTVEQADYLRP